MGLWRAMTLGKMEIVNLLSAFHGYTSYLEISTATTGGEFRWIDVSLLTKSHRLAYNVSTEFDDGAPIEFRSATLDIAQCVAELDRRGARYDIVLVDPYHDYECSYRDLELAFRVLDDGGTIVVHDVLPPSTGRIINQTFVPGTWCGLTFIAYVDFLMKETPVFCTVDCDYGCGIVTKERQNDTFAGLREGWQNARANHEQAFRFLSRHKHRLLNLQTAGDFVRRHDCPATRAYLGRMRRARAARLVRRLWNA